MILFKKTKDLRAYLENQKNQGLSIGFAPTMGALHEGHLSLVERSRTDNSITVSSIFVNPTQFNDPADFEKYPVTIERDILLLESAGCDILFLPSFSEVYPSGKPTNEHYDLGFLETVLDGTYRPGHFQGVCQVVSRLLAIVQPDNLYLGQKDYQQCMVITRLVELMGLRDVIKINLCPTLREPGGLAMSSRNTRLGQEERKRASVIFKALTEIKNGLDAGDIQKLKQAAIARLEQAGFRPDYVEIADQRSLKPVTRFDGKQKLVALVAAYLNDVRLIDNMILN